MTKCGQCGLDGFVTKIHEGTGRTYLVSPQSGNAHTCKPKQTEADKYWCFACGDDGAAIPKSNPCVHRRPDELKAFTEKQRLKTEPQKRLFESDDD